MGDRELKLHIGCGEKYLPGYVNIDYPPSEHTVMKVKADVYQDLRTLDYPENSAAEIRSHHLFEHFPRAEALKILLRWRKWLKPDGLLVIETPDFAACAKAYAFAPTLRRRLQLGRHMLGSQEAKWAYHYDFWDKAKFRFVLRKFGFKEIRARRYANGLAQHFSRYPFLNLIGNLLPESFYQKYGGHKLPNIVVAARKDGGRQPDFQKAARGILAQYLVGREREALLDVWLKDFNS